MLYEYLTINFNIKDIKSQQQQQNLCIICLFRKQVSWHLPALYPPICDGISLYLGVPEDQWPILLLSRTLQMKDDTHLNKMIKS